MTSCCYGNTFENEAGLLKNKYGKCGFLCLYNIHKLSEITMTTVSLVVRMTDF